MTRYIKARMAAKALQRRVAPPWVPTFLQTSRERSIPKPLKEYCPVKKIDLSYYLNIQVGDLVSLAATHTRTKRARWRPLNVSVSWHCHGSSGSGAAWSGPGQEGRGAVD